MKTIHTAYLTLLLYLLVLLAAGCFPGSKRISNMESFFGELSIALDDSVEKKFLAEDADSLFLSHDYDTVYKEVENLIPLIPPHSELYIHLDSIGVRESQVNWLVISYYLYGNGKNIENKTIKRIYHDRLYNKWSYEYEKILKRHTENAKLNDSYFGIGDTVQASMYISPDSNTSPFIHVKGHMRYFTSATDSKLAKFSGIIIEKGCADIYANDLDSSCFYYRLHLLTWDQDIIPITGDSVGTGDTVDLFVIYYGRLFDNYPIRSNP